MTSKSKSGDGESKSGDNESKSGNGKSKRPCKPVYNQ